MRMIKSFFPLDIREHREIYPELIQIYESLAEKALEKGGTISTTYWRTEYDSEEVIFNSKESYLKFLLSSDFYKYEFEEQGFGIRLQRLPGQCKISSILSGKTKSLDILQFRCDFPENNSNNSSFYNRLKIYNDLTVSEFKEHCLDLELNPKDNIKNAFSYDYIDEEYEEGNHKVTYRDKILEIMDVPVCPYCNMNFTVKLQKNGKTVSTADIDHFYPKSKYPQYALCLYNMVPACQVCNSRMKLSQEMTIETHLYPHQDSLEELADFRIINLASYRTNPRSAPKVMLEIRPEKSGTTEAKKVRNSEALFHLNSRYESLGSYTKKLTDRAEIYTEHYTKELEENFKKIFGGVSIRDLAFGPEEDEQEFAKESLGKLKRDLLRQLKVYDSEEPLK